MADVLTLDDVDFDTAVAVTMQATGVGRGQGVGLESQRRGLSPYGGDVRLVDSPTP